MGGGASIRPGVEGVGLSGHALGREDAECSPQSDYAFERVRRRLRLTVNRQLEAGRLPPDSAGDHLPKEELLTLPVDILLPAAIESQITSANADKIRAKLIVEGANGPVTCSSEPILEEGGIPGIPYILANTGGVIVSYFECVQDMQAFFWREDEINDRLELIIKEAFQEVAAIRERDGGTYRDAAYNLAVGRVVEATKDRGIFP